MSYHQLFYHLVWATKHRAPLITPDFEPALHSWIRAKAIDLGAMIFALNGMADHVHLVASIPPTLAVSKFVGQVKGASSARVNRSGSLSTTFAWQDRYGAFTFDKKRLSRVVAYVERQKEHHGERSTIAALERVESEDASK